MPKIALGSPVRWGAGEAVIDRLSVDRPHHAWVAAAPFDLSVLNAFISGDGEDFAEVLCHAARPFRNIFVPFRSITFHSFMCGGGNAVCLPALGPVRIMTTRKFVP